MKKFKELRLQINESEYSGTASPNQSARTNEVISDVTGEKALANLNAMLAAIARSTYLDPIEAYNKIRVRLNIALLDFNWNEVKGKTEVGNYTIPVAVRGIDGSLFLNVDVSLNMDSLYVVYARLQTTAEVVEESLTTAIEEEEVLHLEQSNSARDRQNRDTEEGRKLWTGSHTETELKNIDKKYPLEKEHKNKIFRKKARDVRALVRTNTTPEQRAAAHIKRRGVATGRIYKEDVEQIDELSPALLGRYIKKAGYSASDAANRAGQLRGRGKGNKTPTENDLYKKVIKREKGIAKAVDRLTGGY